MDKLSTIMRWWGWIRDEHEMTERRRDPLSLDKTGQSFNLWSAISHGPLANHLYLSKCESLSSSSVFLHLVDWHPARFFAAVLLLLIKFRSYLLNCVARSREKMLYGTEIPMIRKNRNSTKAPKIAVASRSSTADKPPPPLNDGQWINGLLSTAVCLSLSLFGLGGGGGEFLSQLPLD